MTVEERDEWMNKEALQRDVEVIAEMTEKTEEIEDFPKCRE
jgi:hypothetical protein